MKDRTTTVKRVCAVDARYGAKNIFQFFLTRLPFLLASRYATSRTGIAHRSRVARILSSISLSCATAPPPTFVLCLAVDTRLRTLLIHTRRITSVKRRRLRFLCRSLSDVGEYATRLFVLEATIAVVGLRPIKHSSSVSFWLWKGDICFDTSFARQRVLFQLEYERRAVPSLVCCPLL